MSRPVDWSPLASDDPVPGDPATLRTEAGGISTVADEIAAQVAVLRRIAEADGLSGHYVETLRTGAEDLAGNLEKITDRYREVGARLLGYAPALEQAQSESLTILRRAQEADATRRVEQGLADAVHVPAAPDAPLLPDPDPAVATAQAADRRRAEEARSSALALAARHRDRAQEAAADVDAARRDLERVEAERDRAAEEAARAIRAAVDDDMTDGWWDNVKDWVHEHAGTLNRIATVLGYIGMAALVVSLFVPGLNIVTASILTGVAIATTAGALGLHTATALTGDGSWWDVGLDAVALATFGIGGVAGGGIKIAGRGVTGAAEVAAADLRAAGAIQAGREAATGARGATQALREAAGRAVARGGGRAARGALEAAQAQMRADVTAARAAARAGFGARMDAVGTSSVLERVVVGGTDRGLADLAVQGRWVAGQFPNATRVVAAAGSLETALGIARPALVTNTVVSGVSVVSDLAEDLTGAPPPGIDQLKRWTTRQMVSAW